jgi:hypothetical protein
MQQLQRAGEKWEAWEVRVLAVYRRIRRRLRRSSMSMHNGFGSVSRLCPSIFEADRRSGGAYSREADIGLAPAKLLVDLEKAHPAANSKRYKIMRLARFGRLEAAVWPHGTPRRPRAQRCPAIVLPFFTGVVRL